MNQVMIARDNLLSETASLRESLIQQEEGSRAVVSGLEAELASMRGLVQQLTGENEQLQERVRGQLLPAQLAPPDLTAGGHHNPPDVAVSSHNPDIMGAGVRQGVNPDIMDHGGHQEGGWGWDEAGGGEAAAWFDHQVRGVWH